MAIERRQFRDQLLIASYGTFYIEVAHRWGLTLDLANRLRLVAAQGIAEFLVKLQRYDRLGELVKVSSEYVRGIVNRVTGPVKALAISIRGVEGVSQFFDSLLGSAQAEYALHIGG